MTNLLLFGATGHLGKEIAQEAVRQGYTVTAVVRNAQKASELAPLVHKCIVADVTNPVTLKNICRGQQIVISALGKSVSPNDRSRPSFHDIDFKANANILAEALKSNIEKFVYVSALHSERYLHLEYFRTHHDFSEKLKLSGINYSIIKPPAIFSAFLDMIPMAKKGMLTTIGAGDKRTNPIFEGDLAKVCVASINTVNATIEAGGQHIYTRAGLNNIIQQKVNPAKKVRKIPASFLKLTLPLLRIFDKNSYDKFAFFMEVMQHDTIAPQVGDMKFEDYIDVMLKR